MNQGASGLSKISYLNRIHVQPLAAIPFSHLVPLISQIAKFLTLTLIIELWCTTLLANQTLFYYRISQA